MRRRLPAIITLAVWAVVASARGDVLSNLAVHYEFENAQDFAENSVGSGGWTCG
jgi:hypothetical protein